MRTVLVVVVLIFVSSLAVSAQSMFDKVNDFDGDGRADYAVTRVENGLKVWHIWRSTAGYVGLQWGVADDVVTAGDYDGDGKTDIAVTRMAFGPGGNQGWIITLYYLASSTGTVGIAQLETFNVVGAAAVSNEDYDADGKTDLGFYQWHGIGGIIYLKSSTGTTASVNMNWFLARTGDVIGGSAADVVSHNLSSGEVTIRDPAQGSVLNVTFGAIGDRWVAADFDGDNKGEFSIFRPTTGDWWSLRTSDFVVRVVHFGINGDVPVPADYDNDGKSDHAVYRPGTPQSTFYVLGSTAGFSAFGFGVQSDAAVTY